MDFGERFGFAALVAAVLFVLMYLFGRKMISIAEKLSDRHIRFLDKTEEVQSRNSDELTDIKRIETQQAETLNRLAQGQEELLRRQPRTSDGPGWGSGQKS